LSYELIIQKNSSGVEIALLSGKKLVEFHKETAGSAIQVGNFYLGKIRKISPTLNAAFVDIGADKDAFLTYFDLGPNVRSLKKFTHLIQHGGLKSPELDGFVLEPQTVKTGKISQVFKVGDRVLVQVTKEPIASKGPKVTCDISLAGRYFVLVPFANNISISKKIGTPAEKKRLKDLAASLRPENFGVIIRTVSEGVDIEELDKDLRNLVKKWDELKLKLHTAKISDLVLGEGNRLHTLLRDVLNEDFTQIVVNDSALYTELKTYLQRISPQSEKILKQHQGKNSVFDQFGVNRAIKASFGKSVTFSGGAYLVIDHTEALHVIDVNSGSISFDPENREENVFRVNCEAVEEIARQIRLRDMGGIIVIDFIDMRDPKKKAELFKQLRDAMKTDRAKHTILPMSKFGLVQITRERVRPATEIVTTEVCPTCNGTGKMDSSVQLLDRLENTVTYLWENMNHRHLKLKAHPLVINYIKHGLPSIRFKWWMKYKRWLKLESAPHYGLARLEFFDEAGHPIVGE
jgi:ribonuclease G